MDHQIIEKLNANTYTTSICNIYLVDIACTTKCLKHTFYGSLIYATGVKLLKAECKYAHAYTCNIYLVDHAWQNV